MPLSLKSPEAERLARALAHATGESLTLAITRALEERLARIESDESLTRYARSVERVQQRLRERPVLDARCADDLIGYGSDGAPR